MIEPEKAARFGYKEVTPYPQLIHAIGLLHTARNVDIKYAVSHIKSILKQKKDSFAISILYESKRSSKEVYVVKTYKDGIDGYEKSLKERLNYAKIGFDSDTQSTLTELTSKKTSLSYAINSHVYAALSCHFRIVIVYDITRGKHRMFMKDFSNQTKKVTPKKVNNAAP